MRTIPRDEFVSPLRVHFPFPLGPAERQKETCDLSYGWLQIHGLSSGGLGSRRYSTRSGGEHYGKVLQVVEHQNKVSYL